MSTPTTRRPAIQLSATTPNWQSLGGDQDTQRAKGGTITMLLAPTGADPRQAKEQPATIPATPAEQAPRPTIEAATPRLAPSGGAQPAGRQSGTATHTTLAAGAEAGPDQTARLGTKPIRDSLSDPATAKKKRVRARPETSDRTLAFAANVVTDLEDVRTAMEHRLRALTRGGPADERIRKGEAKTVADLKPDKDGEERGWALEADDPDVLLLADVVANLLAIETRVIKALERKMRHHRLGAWVNANTGCGEKQVARLLGAIGDPYIRPEIEHDDGTVTPSGPRELASLRKYCGLDVWHRAADQEKRDAHLGRVGGGATNGGDPGQGDGDNQVQDAGVAPHRKSGQHAKWSHEARKRLWCIAHSCINQTRGRKLGTCIVDDNEGDDDDIRLKHADGCACSPFRVVYDDGRRKYGTAIHDRDCPRCKAKAGEPLTKSHKKARAHRLMMRAILKDLWREAKRLHEESAHP